MVLVPLVAWKYVVMMKVFMKHLLTVMVAETVNTAFKMVLILMILDFFSELLQVSLVSRSEFLTF